MTRRWEERLARRDATVSGVVPTRSLDDKPTPPPIPAVALTIRSTVPPLLNSPIAHAPAADGGEVRAPSWTSNPQRALLIVAAGAFTALAALLYFGGFLR